MADHSYLDFDLSLHADANGYLARVINSPGGQGKSAFQLALDDETLYKFLDQMGRRRRGVKQDRVTIAKQVGGNLFRAVFQGDVLTCWRTSLNMAREKSKGLRLRLRLNEATALADLPWELLYDPSVNRFFHLSNQYPLVRYLEMPDPPAPLRVSTPLRVLVMLSLPSDYDELRVEQEYESLNTALQDLQTRGVIELHRLPKADLSTLRAELRARQYQILHFIGHGEFDETNSAGALVLEDARGMGRRVSGETLGVMLRDEDSLRLVVLNACEGARPDLENAFGGVAQSLIQQGIPSVIAMQFEITDQAARKFSQEFYSALAANYPIEAALAEARKALYELPTLTEWVTPVLYSRAPDGMLFEIESAPDGMLFEKESAPEKGGINISGGTVHIYGDVVGGNKNVRGGEQTRKETSDFTTVLPKATEDEFNPIGTWNIQVQDMVGSRLQVKFSPNGTFQMVQQVGMYQVPVNGSWSFNPLTKQLSLQGVVNTFQPFILAVTVTGPLPNGYAAVGSDGIGYVLTRA